MNVGMTATGVQVDDTGNVYVVGILNGTFDFDPGPSIFNLTSVSGEDIYFAKYDSLFNFTWAKQLIITNIDGDTHIHLDNEGNLYVLGDHVGPSDFDPSAGTYILNNSPYSAIYISKYDNGGNFEWVKEIKGGVNKKATDIKSDTNFNIYITGSFQGIPDFDPSPLPQDTFFMHTNLYDDGFLASYDSSGNFRWANEIGGSAACQENTSSLAILNDTSVIVTGRFCGSVDFNPSQLVSNMLSSLGGHECYIAIYNALTGSYNNAVRVGGSTHDSGHGVDVDLDGNIYVAGNFQGTVDFDPGDSTYFLTSPDIVGWFISKLNTDLEFEWANVDDDLWDGFTQIDVVVNSSGHVFASGADLDPTNKTIFAKFDTAGTFLSSVFADGSFSGFYTDKLFTNDDDQVFAVGFYGGTPDVDPTTSVHTLPNPPTSNGGYTLKYGPCNASTAPIITVTDDTVCYGTSVTYNIVSGSLNSATFWGWASWCGNNNFHTGSSYTTPPLTFTQTVSVRGQGGCMSGGPCTEVTVIVLPGATIHSYDTICSGMSFIFPDGSVGSSTVNHTSNFTNVFGCDSDIVTHLYVQPFAATITNVVSGIHATDHSQYNYQWYSCDSGWVAIPGETNYIYYPSSNGNFAVIVDHGMCVDTSICYPFSFTGINEFQQYNIEVWPNPCSSFFNVHIPDGISITLLNIYDCLGMKLYTDINTHSGDFNVPVNHFAPGTYIVETSSMGAKTNYLKLVVW